MKKTLSIILSVLFVFGMLPFSAFAEENNKIAETVTEQAQTVIDEPAPQESKAEIPSSTTALEQTAATDGYYTYTVEDGEAIITDCKTSISGDVTIPSTLGGYPVTSIGDYAFSWCTSLTSITIPDSVTSIGDYAFNNCTSLTSITIPDSVTSFGNRAFKLCTSLESITIPDSVTSIGGGAFDNCTSLESITIPDSVTSIGSYAFEDCTSLTSITIGNGVTSIGEDAFYDCTSLESITIPDSVTSIGSYAFSGCKSLTKVNIADIAAWCNISFGNFSNPLYYAHNLYLNGILVTDLTIPDSVTSIGYNAFDNCTSLTSITIGNGVTSIGEEAFYYCTSLTSITIPDSVTSIGEEAFYQCEYLTIYCNPDSYAEQYAKNNSIPYKYISDAHEHSYTSAVTTEPTCTADGVKTYTCSCGDTYTEKINALGHNPGEWTVIKEATETETGIKVKKCTRCHTELERETIPASGNNSEVYFSCDVENGEITIVGLQSDIIGNNTIPSTLGGYPVTGIGYAAFYNCTKLTGITIPDSVKSIGTRSFLSCNSLTNVTIGNGVTNIGDYAFGYCSELPKITIPNSVKSIGGYAFEKCTKLTSITIPDSVKSIGVNAFDGCSNLTISCVKGSYAEQYAKDNNIPYKYTESPDNPFTDIPATSWYTEASLWCNSHGYITGTSATTFAPNSKLTRAQFVQILAKVSGDDLDAIPYTAKFTDVPNGKWYTKAVMWCVANNITGGTGNGTFSPNGEVTREQLSTFFYAYAKNRGYDISASANLDKYTDAGSIAGWAKTAMRWAIGEGLISGTTATTLSPKTVATRAQAAVIFKNFVEGYATKQGK